MFHYYSATSRFLHNSVTKSTLEMEYLTRGYEWCVSQLDGRIVNNTFTQLSSISPPSLQFLTAPVVFCVCHFTQDSDIQSALLADSREAISQILQESTTFHSSSSSSSFSLSLSKSSSRLEQSLTTITDQFESPDTLEIGDCFDWIHSLSHESAEILIHFLELSCPLLSF